MTAFVLVPGACHGGWWYDPLVEALTADGHTVDALTLVGLETEPDVDRRITVDTHIDQVARAVRRAATRAGTATDVDAERGGNDEQVVLVGHSYAGAPCIAAADRHPDMVAALVLLDAFLPHDGDSCWSLTSDEQRHRYVTGCAATGDGVEPLPFFDERARPHPIGSLMQTVNLTDAWRQVPVDGLLIRRRDSGGPARRPRADAASPWTEQMTGFPQPNGPEARVAGAAVPQPGEGAPTATTTAVTTADPFARGAGATLVGSPAWFSPTPPPRRPPRSTCPPRSRYWDACSATRRSAGRSRR